MQYNNGMLVNNGNVYKNVMLIPLQSMVCPVLIACSATADVSHKCYPMK